MRRLKYILLGAMMIFLTLPGFTAAHGGVEKSIGNVTVYLTQSPLSPLVGEKVSFNFVFTSKADALIHYPNLAVKLTLIDTYYGDATKDKIISAQQLITDVNGAINFDYVFSKQNYFDIELAFKDPSNSQDYLTGFLVQPRAMPNQGQAKQQPYLIGWTAVISLIVGWGIGYSLTRKTLPAR